MSVKRRRPVGAELTGAGVHFRVWAPARQRIDVVVDGRDFALTSEDRGYFSGVVADAAAGTTYRFRVDGRDQLFPDPASRFQPEGPHGPSQVIDPDNFRWRDSSWRGLARRGAVITEIHIGTFTEEGTFAAATEKLPLLAEVGINVVEVMPVNEFPGRFGWGYDGVDLWAPTRLYGTPDEFRRFVDSAHQLGLGVLLDVVYNHLGPDGCFLTQFTPDYFTGKYENEWGEAINFDGDNARGAREFFAENAAYWIDEFHLDGLRFDATQSIHDQSRPHVLREITDAARAAAKGRSIYLVAENEPQSVELLNEYGVDALWNDDWHHAAAVALTGRTEAYYTDYQGRPQEFVSMAKGGFLYQGQPYKWQKQRRGTPSFGIPAERFICYLTDHDQVANSASGTRVHQLTSPALLRAMTALLLLGPQTPMLFQGEEFAAPQPFLYFADHKPDLAMLVAKGRREFLSQFPTIATAEMRELLPPPHDPQTFMRCKLDWTSRERNHEWLALHRDLIRLRRDDPTFSAQDNERLHGAVLSESAFVLRWMTGGENDRLLILNLGRDLELAPAPEPLLAPPAGMRWTLQWSSESPAYGGRGTPQVESDERWFLPGRAAVVMRAESAIHELQKS